MRCKTLHPKNTLMLIHVFSGCTVNEELFLYQVETPPPYTSKKVVDQYYTTVSFSAVGPCLLSDLLLPENSAARRPYVGCMRLLLINGRPVSFTKADLVRGAVSVGTCPAA